MSMRKLLIGLVTSAVAMFAFAGTSAAVPFIDGTTSMTELEPDLWLFTLSVVDPDTAPEDAGSFFIQIEIDPFEGRSINQVLFNSAVAVNDETSATNFDGVVGYTKRDDTWVGSDWNSTPPFNGVQQDDAGTFFNFSGGTPGGEKFTDVFLMQILVSGGIGDAASFVGEIGRAGQTFPVEGVLFAPEPNTAALLGIGLTGLAMLSGRRN